MPFRVVSRKELDEMAHRARLEIASQAMIDAGIDALSRFDLDHDPWAAVVCGIFEAMQAADDADPPAA